MDGTALTRPPAPAVTRGLWEIEAVGPDRYVGWGRDGAMGRIFGGQVASQALAAAGADLPRGWWPTSLHAYFVRAGRSAEPIVYRVEHVDSPEAEEGARVRRVTAEQSDRPIFILDARFAPSPVAARLPAAAEGPDEEPATDLWVPQAPEMRNWLAERTRHMRFDMRFTAEPSRMAGRRGIVTDGQRFWLRAVDGLPDDGLDHACGLTYISDMFLVSTALAVHGLPGRRRDIESASLDHAIWFHRPVRVDDWVLYEQVSPTSSGGRGLSVGRLHDRAGRLVASVQQEVLLRVPPVQRPQASTVDS